MNKIIVLIFLCGCATVAVDHDHSTEITKTNIVIEKQKVYFTRDEKTLKLFPKKIVYSMESLETFVDGDKKNSTRNKIEKIWENPDVIKIEKSEKQIPLEGRLSR